MSHPDARKEINKVPPEEVPAWLYRWGRPQTRNILRAFLRWLASGEPARTLNAFVARETGLRLKAAAASLYRLVQRGIIRTLQRDGRQPTLATLGAGLDADKLRRLLGDAMEAPDAAIPTCPICGRQVTEGRPCGNCRRIEANGGEWLKLRLDYYQARALRGLPLFTPPPPWAHDASGLGGIAPLVTSGEHNDESNDEEDDDAGAE